MNKNKIRLENFKNYYSKIFHIKKILKKSSISEVIINKNNIFLKNNTELNFILSSQQARQTHLEALSFGFYEDEILRLIVRF